MVNVCLADDACIAPTNNRDFIVATHHNCRVEACFDRYPKFNKFYPAHRSNY